MGDRPDSFLGIAYTNTLSPAQRRVARFLVENTAEAATMSSVELARQAGVSQPSVTRFAAALGLSGFPALKDHLRFAMLSKEKSRSVGQRANTYQVAVTDQIGHLERLVESLADSDRLVTLGRSLMDSEPLLVFGARIAESVATYFAYCARKFHTDVRLFTAADSSTSEGIARSVAMGGAWIVVFLMPRYPRESLQMLREARSAGLRVLLVTDTDMSPAASEADAVLVCGVSSQSVFNSLGGAMTISAVLLDAMCDALPSLTQSRLEEFETFAESHALFSRE